MIPSVTYPMYFFSLYFLPAALLLIFVSREVFTSWLRLIVWALPLSFLLVFITPVSWTGLGIDLFPFYRDDAARVSGMALSVLSLALVAWHYARSWYKRAQN